MNPPIYNQDQSQQNQVVFSTTPQGQNIEISPTQVIYGGFFRRLFAYLIDNVICGFIGSLIGFIIGTDYIIMFSLSAVVGIIYTAVFDSSELMATPGKAMLNISVVNSSTLQRITFKDAVIRFLSKYLSALMFCLGYLIQPFTEKRQALHDFFANTVVIKKDPGALSYWKAFKDNFNRLVNN